MDGKRTAVITGASSGIGKEVAKALARDGWRIIGTGRDPARMASAAAQIRAGAADATVEMLFADLSLMASAEDLAGQVVALTDRLDLLVNNAGGMASEQAMTPEGLEANFAGNHLGPFLLTQRLLPLLVATARAAPRGTVRILNTSSDASEMIPSLDFDDMQGLANYDPGLGYCRGKLANVLFTRALAERLDDEGIFVHAVHPGAVDSNFFNAASAETQARVRDLPKATEEEGADTLVWLATAESGTRVNGGYWYRRELRQPNPFVEQDGVLGRFWDESERLIAAARAPA